MGEHGGRVLVVDDDAAVRLTLKSFLEGEGLVVETADDGAEALDLLHRGLQVDVILLDLMMPVLSGWQFLDIKATDALIRAIPVIMTTAFEHEGVRLNQVVAMLRKPFDLDRLRAEVHKAIDAPAIAPIGPAPV
jgi:CheY-like chemotaxis protein